MSATRIHPAAVFRPRYKHETLPATLKLRSLEWGVLFSLTGRHTVAQIGERFALSPEQQQEVFNRLLAAELVVERELALEEYLLAASTSGDPEPRTFAELLRGAPLRPAAPPVVTAAGAARPAGRSVAAPPGAPPAFRPLAVEEPTMPPTTAPSRGLSLRALLAFIRGRAADETAGQLDVYRAFLRVDPELLKRHGITTLRFEDDRVVHDAELTRRIVHSVESTLGVRCPAQVFV